VEFCPTGTLDLDDRFKVTVVHPEKCIACRMCELRCPDMAIFVQKAPTKDQPKSEVRSQRSEVRSEGADKKGDAAA
jgi:2-oxoglutarate ferredoxin oxidoreductase subunit delta